MRKLPKVAWLRASVYLGISILGLALFLACYCMISGRSLAEALGSFWIAIAIALATSAITAVRDQRQDTGTEYSEPEL